MVKAWIFLILPLAAALSAADLPAGLPALPWHLTARPWKPLEIPATAYLDVIEGVCRVAVKHQAPDGSIIDPYLKREHQYSTPYFAFAVGVLLQGQRGGELKEAGIRAMERSTAALAGGAKAIPDQHGEFFLAALSEAIHLYAPHVPEATHQRWQQRLATPVDAIWEGSKSHRNNWRTYAVKGQWRRDDAAFVQRHWDDSQAARILLDKWNLYQDHSSDPESLAVEAVGRGNLLSMMDAIPELAAAVRRGTQTSLLLQSPDGQAPVNGRTDAHVFNDVLYQLAFQSLAGRTQDKRLAGQYQRAALLAFQSLQRWRRSDGEWAGSFFITKNRFEPGERAGYQPASQWGNYNGAVMMHLGEAWMQRAFLKSEPKQQPTPAEIGGYALELDPGFGAAFANAGGMQVAVNLRGDTAGRYERYWSAMGVVRFSRAGWDARLGPSDGERDFKTGRGVSFAPTWETAQGWVRLADVPHRYRVAFAPTEASPALVRFVLRFIPLDPAFGPLCRQDFTVTPDGVLVEQRCEAPEGMRTGITLPLVKDDGQPLRVKVEGRLATVSYAENGDEQAFLALDAGSSITATDEPLRSSYGWLTPARTMSSRVFIYPRSPGDPPAAEVLQSFQVTGSGFSTKLGAVRGGVYTGRTSAGGSCAGAPIPFNGPCQFLAQMEGARVMALETDRAVTATINGRPVPLRAHVPWVRAASR
ncbi:MAG: hypothetical protein IPJ98_15925 [Bryobacterales bacterium]|nr:hypothetical protein [Bryobacterales bacterium]